MRILMSMFGWNDSGGGTILPRLTALELQKRGHEVLVIYSAVPQVLNAPAYQLHEHNDEGVRLIGIHNRPALFMDDKNPEREVNDPQVVKIFKHFFDEFQPDIVHYHNFLGLSLGITQVAYEAGIPSFYTPYNFWLLCPTLYLNLPNLALCQGVNETGSNCLQCTYASHPGDAYVQRRDQLRERFQRQVGPCLASSKCVSDLLLHNGYQSDQVEILKFANERSAKIWQEAGEKRQPKVNTGKLKIGFTGSVIPIKGVHTLVEAAQQLQGNVEIIVYGKAPEQYLAYLQSLDTRNKVNFAGFFTDEDHSKILSELDLAVVPSVCYDHSPLVIGEFLAARTPVIGANIGGIPDYIPPGCGELFEAGNAESLAQVLQKYIDEPELIVDMQNHIQEPLSFHDYVSTLENRYRQAFRQEQEHFRIARYERWLQRRGEHAFYHAETLEALTLKMIENHHLPYGVDLWPQFALKEKELEKAQWIVSPTTSEKVSQSRTLIYKAKYQNLPYYSFTEDPLILELGLEYTIKILLPIHPYGLVSKKLLENYLAFPPDPSTVLVLLPWQQSFEATEKMVTAWLGNMPETDHEITLFDSPTEAKDMQLILQESTHILLPSDLDTKNLLTAYITLCKNIITAQPLKLDRHWSKAQKLAFLSNDKEYVQWTHQQSDTKHTEEQIQYLRNLQALDYL